MGEGALKDEKLLHTQGWGQGQLQNLRGQCSNRCLEGKMEKTNHRDHC